MLTMWGSPSLNLKKQWQKRRQMPPESQLVVSCSPYYLVLNALEGRRALRGHGKTLQGGSAKPGRQLQPWTVQELSLARPPRGPCLLSSRPSTTWQERPSHLLLCSHSHHSSCAAELPYSLPLWELTVRGLFLKKVRTWLSYKYKTNTVVLCLIQQMREPVRYCSSFKECQEPHRNRQEGLQKWI